VLLRLGVDEPLIMIPVQLAVGVAAPLALHFISEQVRFSVLIRAPRWLTGVAVEPVRRANARTP
jgi:hypothetical protein